MLLLKFSSPRIYDGFCFRQRSAQTSFKSKRFSLVRKGTAIYQRFSSVKGIFEGLYIAAPDTYLGIMKSPGTGSMIISMYYPIFEDQTCIGYVGACVYASRLMDALLNLNIKGFLWSGIMRQKFMVQ